VAGAGSADPTSVFAATPTKQPAVFAVTSTATDLDRHDETAQGFCTEPKLRWNIQIPNRTTAVSDSDQDQRNRDLVRALYEASFGGDVNAFPNAMLDDFEAYVPPVLPWGGVQHGPEAFLTNVLPQLAAAIDFASMRLVSISADGDHVAALLTARSAGGEELWIAEHWTLRAAKLWRLRVFYHDTRPLESARTAIDP
jgi:ketosteroid isomerase-like protein